ncbi:MAG: MBL fold metallo-hydrolase [Bacteroidota bacterium]|nr:MBL fold metallo-hydrolase [Bacteroidota bacterium]
MENLAETIFSSPKEVKIKITNPIRDSIKLSALWVGHSSTLLQIYDKVIILDPLLNNVISAVMTRRQTAAIDIETLPKLDLILVSHAHMDHLSISTLADLDEKFPKAKLVFPKGVEEFLPDYDFEFVRMKTGNSSKQNYTGETKILEGVKVTAVYALHFGGRFGLDSYAWHLPGCTGYIIEYKDVTVFYAGDTLYDEKAYKKLGKKFDIDLAIIPIGPCRDCEELFNFNHVASYGAMLMFNDLKAEYMIPVHYGAISYRNDPDYPLTVLKELMEKEDSKSSLSTGGKLYKDKIIILDEGEQHVFDDVE